MKGPTIALSAYADDVIVFITGGEDVLPLPLVLPLKKMREACNFHHRYTSTMTDKKNPESHIVGFIYEFKRRK